MLELTEMEKMRRQIGITQTELARRAGVSQSLIARIEAGKVDPKFSKVKRIYETLKVLGRGKTLTAADVMTKGIKSVSSRDSVEKAAFLMRRNDISQLPVEDEGVFVGSISEKDVLDRVADEARLEELSLTPVNEVMKPAFPEVTKDTPLMLLSSLLDYNRAVLVKDNGKTVGIVSPSDLLKLVHR